MELTDETIALLNWLLVRTFTASTFGLKIFVIIV